MVKRKIIWSKTAYFQRKNILLYWLHRNKSNVYSKKLLLEISKNAENLIKFPDLGKPTDITNIRVLVMNNYSLFYTYSKTEIIIVTFWDNRQDPELLEIILSSSE